MGEKKAKRKTVGARSAVSGRFVTKSEAQRNPRETVKVTKKTK